MVDKGAVRIQIEELRAKKMLRMKANFGTYAVDKGRETKRGEDGRSLTKAARVWFENRLSDSVLQWFSTGFSQDGERRSEILVYGCLVSPKTKRLEGVMGLLMKEEREWRVSAAEVVFEVLLLAARKGEKERRPIR
ncbi:hypothetical protein HAX54_051359, partial [Datura stramonium]|nr:hypothetical protein [Datura stramonium]